MQKETGRNTIDTRTLILDRGGYYISGKGRVNNIIKEKSNGENSDELTVQKESEDKINKELE